MKYIKIGLKGLVIQIIKKSIRKVQSILYPKEKNINVSYFEWDRTQLAKIKYKIDKQVDIILSNNPPHEAYMFFPLGKKPDMKESFCFVIYFQGKIAGWGWLHKGLRLDTDVAKLNINHSNYLWMGPDYIKPKFRGKSLQKAIIYKRLMFLSTELSKELKVVTMIGAQNIPSIKSYEYFGFVNKNKIEIYD